MLVSKNAVIARINRNLWHGGGVLEKSRGERVRISIGDYYVLNVNHNFIFRHHVNVEVLARELGVLEEWEQVEDEEEATVS